MTETDNHHQGETIAPVDFTPIGSTRSKPAIIRFRPLVLIISAALLISVVILSGLLTAKTLIVETIPADADISLDGLTFRLSGNFLVWPGEYQITVKSPGYFENTKTIKISEDQSQKLTLELKKMPGHLQITSLPEAAEIALNGKPAGTTPTTVSDLPPGKYQISLIKPRYQPFNLDLEIDGLDKTQTLQAQLQPAWGELVINSIPVGANVLVSGESRGITPLTTELLNTGETVTLKLAGHKQWQQTLNVAVGETLQIPAIPLQPADGLLVVTSKPANASITVNGKFAGLTPTELELAPGQTHKIRLFLDGYQMVSKAVQLKTGVEQTLAINLTPQQGQVRIIVKPEDANIIIDGQTQGSSGQTFNLSAKAHQIEIRRPGFASEKRTITPRVGIEQVLQIIMQTETAARWANTPQKITTAAGQALKLFRPEQSFTMGASRREPGRRSNEVSQHVRLERPFYLATHQVTNQQYKAFDKQHSSSHASGTTLDSPYQPVVSISWQQAAFYCNWLSAQQNLPTFYTVSGNKIVGINPDATGYRLPTEAEWAWAARVEKNAMLKFPWGETFPPAQISGNYADKTGAKIVGKILPQYNDRFAASAPVGSFTSNSKGLFDLGSNVQEWVNDYYGIEPSLSTKAQVDPMGPEKGEFRVIRGASWRDADITSMRLSYRDYGLEGKDNLGFRVARYVD